MRPPRTVWLDVLAAGSVTWALSLPAAAYFAATGGPARALAAPFYAVGAVICHQLAERSFHFWTTQLPVCARCVGIYGGAAMAGMMLALRSRRADIVAEPVRRPRALFVVAVLPSALTLAYEWATGDPSSNGIRAAAGIPIGAAAAVLIGTLR